MDNHNEGSQGDGHMSISDIWYTDLSLETDDSAGDRSLLKGHYGDAIDNPKASKYIFTFSVQRTNSLQTVVIQYWNVQISKSHLIKRGSFSSIIES